ncbi:MAG: GNAT family acetyltransferase [Candidatus Latescibacteria bacterium]|nr:GNAT family acetyltransferase [Candidatus Latescibacterota bacterium]NIM21819.1 GNAT family acetyltransferase [Candidatus Latescibacterota bacterium]NIM65957.1 GNAT family acetyltransferase [Candidatus Latescibacterota bacterium]NIO02702.1 GNAT family acetyltransferase [Candidatus Latescibacterota bacterium]NIO29683.1 GNAT family acetyltransferase [Candidatus Latescibacterota bacterium]
MRTLDAILKPKSVAVVGATPRKGSIGHELMKSIIQYEYNGKLFPVNPKYEFINSIKAYPTVQSIPDPVDLAIVIVPKESVLTVAEDCGKKGVKGLVVISAGFKEIGGEGAKREEALLELKKKYGFRIVGPNCMGIINAAQDVSLNATFAPITPESGKLAFMSQSGALGVAILQGLHKLNLGLSYFVSVGNKADVSGNDLLEYWGSDEQTQVIALYLESFGDPVRFTELSKRISKKKPIVVVKSGTTAAGARAASSHTGALAGLEIAVDALLHQCGVIRVSTIDEMMDLVFALTKSPLPKGDRICIVTNAGGPGIMTADAVETLGLKMAQLSDKTKARLKKFLPTEASVSNPVDMIASAGPEEYGKTLDHVLGDSGVDMVITGFVPPLMIEPKDVVSRITEVSRRYDKPVLSVLMAEERFYNELPRLIKDAPPFYQFPESPVRVAADMYHYCQWRNRPEGKIETFSVKPNAAEPIICKKRSEGGGFLPPTEVYAILEAYGFPVCKHVLVPKRGDIIEAAEHVGFPLVLKVHGENIIHKSDIGGVVIGIKTAQELRNARRQMEDGCEAAGVLDRVSGFFVQEMVPSGKEVILGMSVDEKFGPLVMFGMGGKYVEILKDITFRVMPVTDVDAKEMVKEIKSYPLLEGVRGEKRVDIEFLVESIQRLAQLVREVRCIKELDINPFILNPDRKDCKVVDARICLDEKQLY